MWDGCENVVTDTKTQYVVTISNYKQHHIHVHSLCITAHFVGTFLTLFMSENITLEFVFQLTISSYKSIFATRIRLSYIFIIAATNFVLNKYRKYGFTSLAMSPCNLHCRVSLLWNKCRLYRSAMYRYMFQQIVPVLNIFPYFLAQCKANVYTLSNPHLCMLHI